MRVLTLWLLTSLFSILHAGEPPRFNVRLRINRTVSAPTAGTIDFGTSGIPVNTGRGITGRAPGGIEVRAKHSATGYGLVVDGQTLAIPENASAAVDIHGLPFVIRSTSNSLEWIPHYRAEGILRLGACAANITVYDADGNGLFDDLAQPTALGVDLYDDGHFRFGTTVELCGRLLQAEGIAADGSSITFSERARLIPEVGKTAPALSVHTITGQTIQIDQHRFKPLIIDFWASWCSVCISEFPALEELYSNRTVDIISINIDDVSSVSSARAVLSRNRPAWPQVVTGQGVATSAWQAFQSLSYAGGLPVYAVIDEGGVLRYAGTGGGPALPEIKAALAAISR
jgi:thiol-disulfide isomerase/thioredoxin